MIKQDKAGFTWPFLGALIGMAVAASLEHFAGSTLGEGLLRVGILVGGVGGWVYGFYRLSFDFGQLDQVRLQVDAVRSSNDGSDTQDSFAAVGWAPNEELSQKIPRFARGYLEWKKLLSQRGLSFQEPLVLKSTFQDRSVQFTWTPRPEHSFSQPRWELNDHQYALGSSSRIVHGIRLELPACGAQIAAFAGVTTVNVLDTEKGFIGSIWSDKPLKPSSLFAGNVPPYHFEIVDKARGIGPGFRVTILVEQIVLDSVAPAADYSIEDLKAAVRYVNDLESCLVGILGCIFTEPEECWDFVPDHILVEVALRRPGNEPTAFLIDRIMANGPTPWTARAFIELHKRISRSQFVEHAIPWLQRYVLDDELLETLLELGQFELAELVRIFEGMVLRLGPLTQLEAALLSDFTDYGDAALAPKLGKRIARGTQMGKPKKWIAAHDRARLAVISRGGEESRGAVSVVGGQIGGLSRPNE